MTASELISFRTYPHLYFGAGARRQTGARARALGGSRALVVADAGIASGPGLHDILQSLADAGLAYELYSDTEPEPSLAAVQRLAGFCKSHPFDIMIVAGGGSAIDMSKAARVLIDNPGPITEYVGLDRVPNPPSVPLILLPSTAGSGSEVTIWSVLSDKEHNIKPVVGGRYLAANVTICDPVLTTTVPAAVTASTGMDAFSHGIETFVSRKASPMTDLFAGHAIELIAGALPAAVRDGNDLDARSRMLLGSVLAMTAGDNANWGLCHAMASPLGVRFGVPHRIAIGIMLPLVMAYNVPAATARYAEMGRLLGGSTRGLSADAAAARAVARVQEIIAEIGVPTRLSEVGARAAELADVARISARSFHMATNPRLAGEAEILALLQQAF